MLKLFNLEIGSHMDYRVDTSIEQLFYILYINIKQAKSIKSITL